MPITKRFGTSHYLEDFEEIEEHSPLFSSLDYSIFLEENENIFEEEKIPNSSFWEKCWTFLKLNFM
jgi:hypothetical protein